jgi:hypothetical protein
LKQKGLKLRVLRSWRPNSHFKSLKAEVQKLMIKRPYKYWKIKNTIQIIRKQIKSYTPSMCMEFLHCQMSIKTIKICVTRTLQIEDVSKVWHDSGSCDYIKLTHFLKSLSVSGYEHRNKNLNALKKLKKINK